MECAIEMKNISMVFGKFKANDNINLSVKKNEIHAIIGENGAGKSTLMSILFGLYQPTSGSIMVNGQKVIIKSPLEATKLKIGMVHQHFKLVETFSILDNIVLNQEKTRYGFIDNQEARKKITAIMKKYHFELDLDKKILNATVAEQQRTEILKILYRDCDILIFDEPSAVLTPQQIDEFLQALINLQKLGKTIIIISHKLDELKKVANRGTIIRRGKVIDVIDIKKTSQQKIAQLMVGKSVKSLKPKNLHFNKSKIPALLIENLNVKKLNGKSLTLKNFSLKINQGEIVAISGIEGNGQTELVNAITGLQLPVSGKIYFYQNSWKSNQKITKEILVLNNQIKKLKSQTNSFVKNQELEKLTENLNSYQKLVSKSDKFDMTYDSVKSRYIHGLSYVPEDRHKYGLVLDMTVWENTIMQDYWLPKNCRWSFLRFRNIKLEAQKMMKNFDIRANYGVESIVRYMSGGNQQKLIIGRELSKINNAILVISQPTRGLDIGAMNKMHQLIIDAKTRGQAILLVSSELDEIITLADRIVVINNGQKIKEISSKNVTKQKLGYFMMQQKKQKRIPKHEITTKK